MVTNWRIALILIHFFFFFSNYRFFSGALFWIFLVSIENKPREHIVMIKKGFKKHKTLAYKIYSAVFPRRYPGRYNAVAGQHL